MDRLRKTAQSLKDIQLIVEDECNLFIGEVETIHNTYSEDQQEVVHAVDMDGDNHLDLANLLMENNHVDLKEFQSTLVSLYLQAMLKCPIVSSRF